MGLKDQRTIEPAEGSCEFTPNIHAIQECLNYPDLTAYYKEQNQDWYQPEKAVHLADTVYLLLGEKNLLFDTLSIAGHDHILASLEKILDGDDLDYLVVSHTEAPHGGNTFPILREYPEATLVASDHSTNHERYLLDNAMLVGPGDSIDLGDHIVEFHEAPFPDTALTLWMFETNSRTLFTVDWLGFPHHETECLQPADEMESDVTPTRLYEFNGRALQWLTYAETDRIDAEVDQLLETFRPNIVAPAHGLPIREDAEKYVQMFKPTARMIAEEGSPGTL